jgi:hypothetical protein
MRAPYERNGSHDEVRLQGTAEVTEETATCRSESHLRRGLEVRTPMFVEQDAETKMEFAAMNEGWEFVLGITRLYV